MEEGIVTAFTFCAFETNMAFIDERFSCDFHFYKIMKYKLYLE